VVGGNIAERRVEGRGAVGVDGAIDQLDRGVDLGRGRVIVIPQRLEPGVGARAIAERLRTDDGQGRERHGRRAVAGGRLGALWFRPAQPAARRGWRAGDPDDEDAVALGFAGEVAPLVEAGAPGELELDERKQLGAVHARRGLLGAAGHYSPMWALEAARPLRSASFSACPLRAGVA
jgi:hypothetical protein